MFRCMLGLGLVLGRLHDSHRVTDPCAGVERLDTLQQCNLKPTQYSLQSALVRPTPDAKIMITSSVQLPVAMLVTHGPEPSTTGTLTSQQTIDTAHPMGSSDAPEQQASAPTLGTPPDLDPAALQHPLDLAALVPICRCLKPARPHVCGTAHLQHSTSSL